MEEKKVKFEEDNLVEIFNKLSANILEQLEKETIISEGTQKMISLATEVHREIYLL